MPVVLSTVGVKYGLNSPTQGVCRGATISVMLGEGTAMTAEPMLEWFERHMS